MRATTSTRRARFAAVLAVAAIAGGVLGACGREQRDTGNPGPVPNTGTVQTNPGGLTPTTKKNPSTTTQPDHPTTTP
jgi:hypothetical protein